MKMNAEQARHEMRVITDKSKLVLRIAESIDAASSSNSAAIHNLWKQTGELHAMVNSLKSEVAGNEPPKVGG